MFRLPWADLQVFSSLFPDRQVCANCKLASYWFTDNRIEWDTSLVVYASNCRFNYVCYSRIWVLLSIGRVDPLHRVNSFGLRFVFLITLVQLPIVSWAQDGYEMVNTNTLLVTCRWVSWLRAESSLVSNKREWKNCCIINNPT